MLAEWTLTRGFENGLVTDALHGRRLDAQMLRNDQFWNPFKRRRADVFNHAVARP